MSSPYARPRATDRRPAAAPEGAAAPAGPSLADALDNNRPAVLRIRYRRDRAMRGYHTLTAYSADGRILWLHRDEDTDQLHRTALIAYIRATYPHVNWTRDHDIHLTDGHVYSAPLAEQDGYMPEVDGVFGGGPAVLLDEPVELAVSA